MSQQPWTVLAANATLSYANKESVTEFSKPPEVPEKQYSDRIFKNLWTLNKKKFIHKTKRCKRNQPLQLMACKNPFTTPFPLREAREPNATQLARERPRPSQALPALPPPPTARLWDTGRHGVPGTGFPRTLSCGYLQSLFSHLLLLATAVAA